MAYKPTVETPEEQQHIKQIIEPVAPCKINAASIEPLANTWKVLKETALKDIDPEKDDFIKK